MADRLSLVLSLDVEEEGLFSGQYDTGAPPIANTACLGRLGPILDRGVKPTLFCAYSAFADAPSRKMLEQMRDRRGAEIGAHLHHWNTPPSASGAHAGKLASVSSSLVPDDILAAKMENLFAIARDFQSAPVESFRMGRWDLRASHWTILKNMGVGCDASVRPLHFGRSPTSAPDHFDAPADPYWIGDILEVPLTVTPIAGMFARMKNPYLKSSLKSWGALALLPVYHPLWLLKLTTRLHVERGGKNLSLTWHSSEMMPGGAPHVPTQAHVDRLIAKVCSYLEWLQSTYSVTFLTMRELRAASEIRFRRVDSGGGDWAGQGGMAYGI